MEKRSSVHFQAGEESLWRRPRYSLYDKMRGLQVNWEKTTEVRLGDKAVLFQLDCHHQRRHCWVHEPGWFSDTLTIIPKIGLMR
jgi:hypothetical protein